MPFVFTETSRNDIPLVLHCLFELLSFSNHDLLYIILSVLPADIRLSSSFHLIANKDDGEMFE